MRNIKGILIFIVTAIAMGGMVASTQAAPTMYQFDSSSYSNAPSGWFIYDRDTASLSDYSITFDSITTFTFPAGNIYSSTNSGFTFSDQTTASGSGQSYNVYLGSFQAWFEIQPHDPASIIFTDASEGSGGRIIAPIYWENTGTGPSGIENLVGNFYSLGPVAVSPVPEPEAYAMLLAGLGLLGFAARRRKQSEAAA